MTIKQEHILKNNVRKCSSMYGAPNVQLLTPNILEAYESNEHEEDMMLGIRLGNVILDFHYIGGLGEKEADYFNFWRDVVVEAKAA